MTAFDTTTKFLVTITALVGVITAVTWWLDRRRR